MPQEEKLAFSSTNQFAGFIGGCLIKSATKSAVRAFCQFNLAVKPEGKAGETTAVARR